MRTKGTLSFAIATCFLCIVGTSVFIERIPSVILGLYVVASLVTFLWYAIDKSAAQRGGGRTPENTLHLLSLVGGWPGALIAQQQLRHKTKKQPFRIIFWATVTLNFGGFIYLYTPDGAAKLQSLITNIMKMANH
ncbi:MAG: DUF1294 domain-containing protein [Desulfuromonadales bacterium]|nr:DUF1294 domain-containing protein [Desulfuromonadales bacterium]